MMVGNLWHGVQLLESDALDGLLSSLVFCFTGEKGILEQLAEHVLNSLSRVHILRPTSARTDCNLSGVFGQRKESKTQYGLRTHSAGPQIPAVPPFTSLVCSLLILVFSMCHICRGCYATLAVTYAQRTRHQPRVSAYV